jgi:xanthine dehydrogenase YagR molybdenum-binding subunit
MRFDTPATTNPIDQLKVVGQPTDRIDGRYKTTGTAPYAYERHDVVPGQAYGFVLGSGIAKGRIAAMHLEEAKTAPGVLAIVTTLDMPRLERGKMNVASCSADRSFSITTRRSPWWSRRPSSRPGPRPT